MKIVPYRVRFDIDWNYEKTGKTTQDGQPTAERIPVEKSEDGVYIIRTHDLGEDPENLNRYYQIAFRIEDPSPYKLEELELHLDSAVFRGNKDIEQNDLVCKKEGKATLWYQPTKYKFNKKYLEGKNERKWEITRTHSVDSITTAGVFKIVVKRNGQLLSNEEQPWVYALPSAVTKKDYCNMLDDLIDLHESLVRKDKSTVGIGMLEEGADEKEQTDFQTATDRECARINDEIKWTVELKEAVEKIMSISSELQRKEYVRMPLRKVRHYDARVMRDYIRYGASGKTTGVTYVEDRDTYENRVIKFVLKRIRQRYGKQERKKEVKWDDEAVNKEYDKRIMSEKYVRLEDGQLGTKMQFYFQYKLPRTCRDLDVCIGEERITMSGPAPFHLLFDLGDEMRWIKLDLKSRSREEHLFYLKKLRECFRLEKGSFHISCTLIKPEAQTVGSYTIHLMHICDITSINGEIFSKSQSGITDQEYNEQIDALCKEENGRFRREQAKLAEKEEKLIKETIKTELQRQNETVEMFNRRINAAAELTKLLEQRWFEKITDITELTEIRPTAKFKMNRYYRTVYKAIMGILNAHCVLASAFDVNAFGVYETHRIYEYWVLHRLLYQLQTIGFELNEDDVASLAAHYQKFVEDHGGNGKASEYRVRAQRKLGEKAIEIEVGYDCEFKAKIEGEKKPLKRTPDYYICVKEQETVDEGDEVQVHENRHWYFMDAKYKSFSRLRNAKGELKKGKTDYLDEVYEVALSKYKTDMGRILKQSNEYGSQHNEICGTYIIMADVDDLPSELSVNNRLFGGKDSLLDISYGQKDKLKVPENEHGCPCHQYGAIHLTPSHVDELQSLLALIFEYLEAGKWHKHHNLQYCWKCGSPQEVKKDPISMSRDGQEKYYDTCQQCGDFRVDNYCWHCEGAIIKHTIGNYHLQDDSKVDQRWAFSCPYCGARVDGSIPNPKIKYEKLLKKQ